MGKGGNITQRSHWAGKTLRLIKRIEKDCSPNQMCICTCACVCVCVLKWTCVCAQTYPQPHIPSHLGYQPWNPHTQPSILPCCCGVHTGFCKTKGFSLFFIHFNSSPVLSLSSTRIHLHSALLSVSVYPCDLDICLAGETRRDAVNTAKNVHLCKSFYCFLFQMKWYNSARCQMRCKCFCEYSSL